MILRQSLKGIKAFIGDDARVECRNARPDPYALSALSDPYALSERRRYVIAVHSNRARVCSL